MCAAVWVCDSVGWGRPCDGANGLFSVDLPCTIDNRDVSIIYACTL